MRIRLFLPTILAFALLVAGVGHGQDAPEPGPAPAGESSPEALEVLRVAIAAQGPEEYTGEGAIRDLTVKIQGEVWDHSGDSVEKTTLDVNRYLTMDPERFRSEWKTTAGTSVYGFDGKRYWFAEYEPGGKLGANHWLLGDKYAEDRERIENEIAETRYLLRFFFLANLKGPHVIFTMLPEETIDSFGKERKVLVIRRENRDPATNEPVVTLRLDAKTHALLSATAHAGEAGQKSLIFSFRYDEALQPRVKGVRFPFRIETREMPWGATESRLANRATVLPDGIDFNSGLDPEMFRRPKPE